MSYGCGRFTKLTPRTLLSQIPEDRQRERAVNRLARIADCRTGPIGTVLADSSAVIATVHRNSAREGHAGAFAATTDAASMACFMCCALADPGATGMSDRREAPDYAVIDELMALPLSTPKGLLTEKGQTATGSAKTCFCAASCRSSRRTPTARPDPSGLPALHGSQSHRAHVRQTQAAPLHRHPLRQIRPVVGELPQPRRRTPRAVSTHSDPPRRSRFWPSARR
jgi:hypothetical protein